MNFKDRFTMFFQRYKRSIIATGLCFLAIIFVGVVAAKSAENNLLNDDNVQTSTPTAITFIMPVENGTIIKDYSNTTLKYNSTLKQWESHKAVDIKGADDANVLAVYDGEVISVETTYLMGTVVKIKHNSSLVTVYGSLDEIVLLNVGDTVTKGQVIGKVSTSAKNESNDGAHLHFEVLLDNVKVDPNLYLETSNK
ncbi:MAG: M23 family metallopeptidase [Clostridia bacterium]|nr:M23 family metallopeptidase [Clostridia bacterium]